MIGKSASGRTSSVIPERADLGGYMHGHPPTDVRLCRCE